MKKYFLALIACVIFASGCSKTPPSGNPKWVDQLVQQFSSQPLGNPPQSVWRYEYHGQVVYYVPAQCCDQYSTLYDNNGNVLCAPDGGLTGRGDGRCPDFNSQRTKETLIWKDPRSP